VQPTRSTCAFSELFSGLAGGTYYQNPELQAACLVFAFGLSTLSNCLAGYTLAEKRRHRPTTRLFDSSQLEFVQFDFSPAEMPQPLTLQDLESTGHSLTDTLNRLLANLHLQFVLESPADLTPTMLLAILECILQSRLPISIAVRASRSEAAKVEAMKIFLGVLENDILQMDVGLSEVDPRKLAAGEWDEVVFVGELLCWLGRQSGILTDDAPGDKLQAGEEEKDDELEDVFGKALDNTVSSNSRGSAGSPSTRSSMTDSANTGLSMLSGSNRGSDTTVMSMSFDDARSISPPITPQPAHRAGDHEAPIATAHRRRPHCIHELEDETFVLRALRDTSTDETVELDSEADFSTSSCDCPTGISGNSPAPVRYTGWLEEVDNDLEIESFEADRRNRALNNSMSKSRSYSALGRSAGRNFSAPSTSSNFFSHSEGSYVVSQGVLTRHNSPTQHTLALMNERAKLLAELASLNTAATRNR
jgi:hypothetical protein